MKNNPKSLNITALSKKLGVHRTTIYRWLRSKHAPKIKNLDSFDKLMEANFRDGRFKGK